MIGAQWASLIALLVKNPPAMQETPVWFLGLEDPQIRDRLPTAVFLGFPCGLAGKESACSVGDLVFIPGLGRSLGEGKGYTLQYSGPENSMDCAVHGVAKSQMGLCNFHFHFSLQMLSEWPVQTGDVQNWTQVISFPVSCFCVWYLCYRQPKNLRFLPPPSDNSKVIFTLLCLICSYFLLEHMIIVF